MERRAAGLTDEELEVLADKIYAKMPRNESCRLSEEQQQAVIDIITTKHKVVKAFMWAILLMMAWVMKDIYHFMTNHIGWLK